MSNWNETKERIRRDCAVSYICAAHGSHGYRKLNYLHASLLARRLNRLGTFAAVVEDVAARDLRPCPGVQDEPIQV